MMRAIFFALLFSLPMISQASAGNGVERGDVSVSGADSIPKGLEDRLEALIFGNCDLRGASLITPSYLTVNDGGMMTVNVNEYRIQYTVQYRDARPSVQIAVQARLHLDAPTGSPCAIELLNLSSPVCKTLP